MQWLSPNNINGNSSFDSLYSNNNSNNSNFFFKKYEHFLKRLSVVVVVDVVDSRAMVSCCCCWYHIMKYKKVKNGNMINLEKVSWIPLLVTWRFCTIGGQLDPPVGDVTFLHHQRSVRSPCWLRTPQNCILAWRSNLGLLLSFIFCHCYYFCRCLSFVVCCRQLLFVFFYIYCLLLFVLYCFSFVVACGLSFIGVYHLSLVVVCCCLLLFVVCCCL